jgi:hypothetical protein
MFFGVSYYLVAKQKEVSIKKMVIIWRPVPALFIFCCSGEVCPAEFSFVNPATLHCRCTVWPEAVWQMKLAAYAMLQFLSLQQQPPIDVVILVLFLLIAALVAIVPTR